MELMLIRHALPLRLEVESGPADPGLADEGREQVARLCRGVRAEAIDAIYTSPLRRAVETAEPLASTLGLALTVDPDLSEWDRDATAYIPMEELKASGHELWQAMAEGRFHDLGIDPLAFRERVERCLGAIAARHPGARVAVVCHGGVINTYAASVLDLDAMLFFEPGYTSITRILVSRLGARSIHTLNEHAHLRDALPG